MGTDLILVRSLPWRVFRAPGSHRNALVPQDADAILELPNVKSAVPGVHRYCHLAARQCRFINRRQTERFRAFP